jgi:hypothetical protein
MFGYITRSILLFFFACLSTIAAIPNTTIYLYLIVSGIMDMDANVVDLERRKRHSHILKQLPGHFMCDVLAETGIADGPLLNEALQIYLTFFSM